MKVLSRLSILLIVLMLLPLSVFSQSITDTTITQIYNSVKKSNINQPILKIKMTKAGAGVMSLSSLGFIWTGTGSTPSTLVSNARVYYTGNDQTFNSSNLLGTVTVSSTTFTFALSTPLNLANGDNYLWFTFDILASATTNSIADVSCTQLLVNSVNYKPYASNPSGGRKIRDYFTGSITVPGERATLDTLFEDIVAVGLSNNLIINLAGNQTLTRQVEINQWPEGGSSSNYSIIVRPSGAARTITGNINDALFKFNGIKKVTFDGRIGGTGTTKSLTIRNMYTGDDPASIFQYSNPTQTAGAGSSNDTVRYCILQNDITKTTNYGIYLSNGIDCDNLTFNNNEFKTMGKAIVLSGDLMTDHTIDNININNNIFGSTTTSEAIGFEAVEIWLANYVLIENNAINGIYVPTGTGLGEIAIGFALTRADNSIIARNKISNIVNSTTDGVGCYGIFYNEGNNSLISNNFISNIATTNYSNTAIDLNSFGINVTGAYNLKIFHNTVLMNGTQSNVGATSPSLSAAFILTGSPVNSLNVTVPFNIILNNNIFVNQQIGLIGSKTYGIFVDMPTGTGTLVDRFSSINYNNFFGANNNIASIGGAEYNNITNLTTTITGSGVICQKLANQSITTLSATDLHLNGQSVGDVELLCPKDNIFTELSYDIDVVSSTPVQRKSPWTMMGADDAYPTVSLLTDFTVTPDQALYSSFTNDNVTFTFTPQIVSYPDGIVRTNPSFTFVWTKDGVQFANNTNTYFIPQVHQADAGLYTVFAYLLKDTITTALSKNLVVEDIAIVSIITNFDGIDPISVNTNTVVDLRIEGVNTIPIGVPLTYQWQVGSMATGTLVWSDIIGENSDFYSLNNLNQVASLYYRVKIQAGQATIVYRQFNIAVWNKLQVITQPVQQIVCKDEKVELIASASGHGTGFLGNPAYHWQRDGEDLDPVKYPTATIPTFRIDNSDYDASGVYRCRITGRDAQPTRDIYTNEVLVYVNSPVKITDYPKNKTVYVVLGQKARIEILTHAPSKPMGYTPTVQWYRNNIMISEDANVTGAKASVLQILNVTPSDVTATYKVVVTSMCGTDMIDNIKLVAVDLTITQQPVSKTICKNGDASFEIVASATNPDETIAYAWMKGEEMLMNGTKYEGVNTNKLIVKDPTALDNGEYHVMLTLQSVGKTVASEIVTLTVNMPPEITSVNFTETKTLTAGDTLRLSVIATGTETISYLWYKDDVMVGLANLNLFQIDSVKDTDAGVYYCKMTNACGEAQTVKCALTVLNKTVTDIEDENSTFTLSETTPNPFNETAQITFTSSNFVRARLFLNDMFGREIELFNGYTKIGTNSVSINASELGLNTGVYYYTLESNGQRITKKMVLVK